MDSLSFHFIRPAWLLAIPVVAWFWWQLKNTNHFKNPWERVCDAHLLPHLIEGQGGTKLPWPWLGLGFAWLLTLFILAGPSWDKSKQPLYRKTNATVIAFDLSRPMATSDLTPSRLARAKYKLQDILNTHREGRLGLVAFAAEPYVVSPLTEDARTLSTMLPELSPNIMPVQGSYISAALRKSVELLRKGHAQAGHILLITNSTPTEEDLATAKKFASQGVVTDVYAIGTEKGGPVPGPDGRFLKDAKGKIQVSSLDVAGLRELAKAGDGQFATFTHDNSDLTTLLRRANTKPIHSNQEPNTQQTSLWQDEGRWFLFLLLPLAALAFRRGWFEEALS